MMHADLAGWTAAGLMVCTFASREAHVMRPLAVATNLAFIVYGALAALPPVLALHLLLLPINLWRWAEGTGAGAFVMRRLTASALRRIAAIALLLVAACGGGDEQTGVPPANTPPPLVL